MTTALPYARSATQAGTPPSKQQRRQRRKQQLQLQHEDEQEEMAEDPTMFLSSSHPQDMNCTSDHCGPRAVSASGGHRKKATDGSLREKYGKRIQPERLYQIPLVPVDCRFGVVRDDEDACHPLHSTIKSQRRMQASTMTVVFCIRRPGCGSCRDHAQQLVKLVEDLNQQEQEMRIIANSGGVVRESSRRSSSKRAEGQKVALVGITKHGQGVDDEAMINFYQTYFQRYPVLKDEQWQTYQALGGRKISLMKLLRMAPRMMRRYEDNNIENVPFGGDIWTQGGVLIFDRSGELRHVQYEEYGKRLDVDEIKTVLRNVQREQRASTA
eukprot:CAMPEP_0198123264 /NCGR_PEP_ID=MMETSP1442-20131203/37119_1 /TAXON_ID= /ORGANISM="Craspedostauros australis, Strain CCMP3328" /LENGTH=325 /DNA_ID=CAMNT_0043782441 /DNA_START=46 /DNA_END=1023 /DNA_ORIENTATION=+